MAVNQDIILREFRRIWGYDDFRPPQGEIVQTLLTGRDALIIMPTGGGKSICFQLPALLQTGLTLVISPLVALMENQVRELREKQLPAALLHSELLVGQRRQVFTAIEQQKLRLLYLSPETLLSPRLWELLCKPELKINAIILDEAHCLVQWGDTFRPAYRRLGAVRRSLMAAKPKGTKISFAAFTATADPLAQTVITECLELQQPQVFRLNPYRSNLNPSVRICWSSRQRYHNLLYFIQKKQKQPGLVYTRTRRDSEELASRLSSQGLVTVAYHAGLGGEVRRRIEGDWIEGKIPFVVSTNAFGMGINKSDVRWVVHYQVPLLLSEYVQEIGRGGRDGESADVLALVSEPTGWLDREDKRRAEFFINSMGETQKQALQLRRKLPQVGDIEEVSKRYPQAAIALAILHAQGYLYWQDPFKYTIRDNLAKKPQSPTDIGNAMHRYLYGRGCRWGYLLTAFGFSQGSDFRCGHCDRCR
ncbi:RecQ family ATP-dependent DNA helicase [Calothrix sp. NIES-3974]|uniref:RecQ family ATP-dependent DNA helicase n=1 Tax=Calothrix sp. NIES-3974 TaxID=2005462 RepID=UPI000B61414F|nr:ATP-dependent DNA helicase RecQ [Calothrix sp. NIES-3974]BAZ06016.1 ATP-dependent DNA helicase RecQ [Calothrix sp. NIES-3974]